MDDNEYYEKMRNRNLNRGFVLPKKKAKKNVEEGRSDFKGWAVTQGKEDAEMLFERKHEENDEQ